MAVASSLPLGLNATESGKARVVNVEPGAGANAGTAGVAAADPENTLAERPAIANTAAIHTTHIRDPDRTPQTRRPQRQYQTTRPRPGPRAATPAALTSIQRPARGWARSEPEHGHTDEPSVSSGSRDPHRRNTSARASSLPRSTACQLPAAARRGSGQPRAHGGSQRRRSSTRTPATRTRPEDSINEHSAPAQRYPSHYPHTRSAAADAAMTSKGARSD